MTTSTKTITTECTLIKHVLFGTSPEHESDDALFSDRVSSHAPAPGRAPSPGHAPGHAPSSDQAPSPGQAHSPDHAPALKGDL